MGGAVRNLRQRRAACPRRRRAAASRAARLTAAELRDLIAVARRRAGGHRALAGIKSARADIILGAALVLEVTLDTDGADALEVTDAGPARRRVLRRSQLLAGTQPLIADVRAHGTAQPRRPALRSTWARAEHVAEPGAGPPRLRSPRPRRSSRPAASDSCCGRPRCCTRSARPSTATAAPPTPATAAQQRPLRLQLRARSRSPAQIVALPAQGHARARTTLAPLARPGDASRRALRAAAAPGHPAPAPTAVHGARLRAERRRPAVWSSTTTTAWATGCLRAPVRRRRVQGPSFGRPLLA